MTQSTVGGEALLPPIPLLLLDERNEVQISWHVGDLSEMMLDFRMTSHPEQLTDDTLRAAIAQTRPIDISLSIYGQERFQVRGLVLNVQRDYEWSWYEYSFRALGPVRFPIY
jgi:hypothetical protein